MDILTLSLKELLRALEGQLTILNAEGFRSELHIYHFTENEEEFVECQHCDDGQIVFVNPEECPYCWFNNNNDHCSLCEGTGFLGGIVEDCPHCDGEGGGWESKTVEYVEDWVESNIFI
jgi:DnaJ-class molecular chaperone